LDTYQVLHCLEYIRLEAKTITHDTLRLALILCGAYFHLDNRENPAAGENYAFSGGPGLDSKGREIAVLVVIDR
jgi:hypothetical protein